jgi:quinol monooxygenase YgiN
MRFFALMWTMRAMPSHECRTRQARLEAFHLMITGLFYMTVKPGRVDAFRDLVTQLVTTTRAEDDGCITYVFHQQRDNPREFVLYEQWHDQTVLDAHLDRLDRMLGIAALFDFFEQTHSVLYDVVA